MTLYNRRESMAIGYDQVVLPHTILWIYIIHRVLNQCH